MEKVIGIVRNECGTITNLVMFNLDSHKKYLVKSSKNSEVLFGRYPLYDEDFNVIGNRGLVILEKNDSNIKLITCAGIYVDDGVEEQIIAKTTRLNMRFINAEVMEDKGRKYIYVL